MNIRKIITATFYELLQEHTIEEISIGRLVEAAEISKPTFYRYYRDKYDLLNQMFDEIFKPMYEAERSITWGAAMLGILTELEKNPKFFQNGFQSNDRHSLRNYNMTCITDAITGLLRHQGVDTERRDMWFSIHACAITHTAAVVGWVRDERRMPKTELVELLKASLPQNLYPYFTL